MRKICYTISLLGIQDRNRRIFSGLEFFFFNDIGLFHIATVAWEHHKLETKSKEAKLTYTRRIYKNSKTSVQFQCQNVNSSRIIRKDLSTKFISQLGKFYETQRYAG